MVCKNVLFQRQKNFAWFWAQEKERTPVGIRGLSNMRAFLLVAVANALGTAARTEIREEALETCPYEKGDGSSMCFAASRLWTRQCVSSFVGFCVTKLSRNIAFVYQVILHSSECVARDFSTG